MEKECSRCQAGDNPNHTHNTEYGKLARSKSKSSLSNPNHTSYARSKALEKGKEGKRFTGLGAVHLKPSEYKDKELIRHTKKIMEKYNR